MINKLKIVLILTATIILGFGCKSSLDNFDESQSAKRNDEFIQTHNLQTLDDMARLKREEQDLAEKKKHDKEMIEEAQRLLEGVVKLHVETMQSIPQPFAAFGLDMMNGIFESAIFWDDEKNALVIKPLRARQEEDLEFIFREFKVKSVEGTKVAFYSPFQHRLKTRNSKTDKMIEEIWDGDVFFEIDVKSNPLSAKFSVDFSYGRDEDNYMHETQEFQAEWNVIIDRNEVEERSDKSSHTDDIPSAQFKTVATGTDTTGLIKVALSFAGHTYEVEKTDIPVRLEIYNQIDGAKIVDTVIKSVSIETGPIIKKELKDNAGRQLTIDMAIDESDFSLQGFVRIEMPSDDLSVTYLFE